jgi:hypothetical protein
VQGVFSMALSLGVLVAVWRPDRPHPALMILAALIWLASIAGESLADAQLAAFKRDPTNKGKVCRAGLWNYSRHPNYFFECLHWFAYVVLALGGPWWWLSLLAPATMALLLLKLSGVPLKVSALTLVGLHIDAYNPPSRIDQPDSRDALRRLRRSSRSRHKPPSESAPRRTRCARACQPRRILHRAVRCSRSSPGAVR